MVESRLQEHCRVDLQTLKKQLDLVFASSSGEDQQLTPEEKAKLSRDGTLNLGVLLTHEQVQKMRARLDAYVEQHGKCEAPEMRGIARMQGVMLLPVNDDGLLDIMFTHPRLLSAMRFVLDTDAFKVFATNFHAPLPGHGHQPLHVDWAGGVPSDHFEVCNAIWLLDDVTDDN